MPSLPLVAVPPPTRPPARPLVPRLYVVPPADQPPLPFEPDPTPDRVDPGIPADLERVARALTVVLVEVLRGRRPLAHAEQFADGDVLETILHLARSRAARGLRLSSIRMQAPVADAVEVALCLTEPARVRAMALRLERWRGRWRCTSLEAALTDAGITRCGRPATRTSR